MSRSWLGLHVPSPHCSSSGSVDGVLAVVHGRLQVRSPDLRRAAQHRREGVGATRWTTCGAIRGEPHDRQPRRLKQACNQLMEQKHFPTACRHISIFPIWNESMSWTQHGEFEIMHGFCNSHLNESTPYVCVCQTHYTYQTYTVHIPNS